MIPLIVAIVGKLYDRDIWVPPLTLLAIIAKQQFLPLIAGMALTAFAPAFSQKVQRALNVVGNVILTVALVALLWKLGPALKAAVPWVFVAAFLLAVSCLAISRLLLSRQTPGLQTLAICNVNRHVGLALLLSGTHLRNAGAATPAIAAYAIAAVLVMAFYTRLFHTAAPSITTAS
jgi:predicted Na+-dependent transporter